MREEYNTLTSRVQQSLLDLEAVIDRTSLLMGKALKKNDDGYLDGVALNLHGFYTGVEQIFEDIARTIDRSLPSGSGWHHNLLLQMSGELKSVRPPVISRETRYCLDEYRSFGMSCETSTPLTSNRPAYKILQNNYRTVTRQ